MMLKLARLQPVLRKITEHLAHELARPGTTPPAWSDVDWSVARAVAAMHGVSPLLSKTLRWCGPAGWVDFLERQRIHTANRHARLDAFVQRIGERLREENIAAVALKGAALHALGLYAAGERPMADVDLLVKPQDMPRAVGLLTSLGFYEYCRSWKERAFMPACAHAVGALGEHSDNDIKVELHDRICEMLPWRITDISSFIFPPTPRPGLNPYPSNAALMAHLLLHAAGAMATQSLRLLQLADLARLCSRMAAADWNSMLDLRARVRGLWWALPPLQLMLNYFPAPLPAAILAALRADCPPLLRLGSRRTLSDVSYSHLWVDAFPGIAWSQSVAEMLRYAGARVLPGTQQQAMRETIGKTQPWALATPWQAMSQGRRILRWVASRQPRPVTLHAVHAALAQQP